MDVADAHELVDFWPVDLWRLPWCCGAGLQLPKHPNASAMVSEPATVAATTTVGLLLRRLGDGHRWFGCIPGGR
jgi:hypothetical protein